MTVQNYLINEIRDKISRRLFNCLYVLTYHNYPTKEDIQKITVKELLAHKGIGKTGVNEFYTVILKKKAPFKVVRTVRYVYENNYVMTQNQEITNLVNILPSIYKDLNFENHCYRRIAYDYVCNDKWNRVISRPFINNCNSVQRNRVLRILKIFTKRKDILLKCNTKSLKYRKN